MGFFDGGVKGASYDPDQGYGMGTTWSGVITKIGEPQQATSYVQPGSNARPEPLFYPSGDPIMELPIEFKADQVQPTADDDGIRVIFFGGEKKKALTRALRQAGLRRDPQVGDWFALTWSANGGPTGRRKLFEAQFRPGNGSAGNFFGDEQPAQAAPAAAPPLATLAAALAPAAPAAPAAAQPQPQAHSAQVAAQLQQPAQAPVQQAPAAAGQQGEARPPWAAAPQAEQAQSTGQGIW